MSRSLLDEHFRQPLQHCGERFGGQPAQPFDEAFRINGPKLIESHEA